MNYIIYINPGNSTQVDDLLEENVRLFSDDLALYYAADFVSALNNTELHAETRDAVIDFLDGIDTAAGNAFCVAIMRDNDFIYGDEETLDIARGVTADVDFIGNKNIDEITEAILNHPKVNEFNNLKLEIAELEKEIKRLMDETKSASSFEFNNNILSFLPKSDQDAYQRIVSEIAKLEQESDDLEKQYNSIEYRYFRTSPYGNRVGVDVIETTLDDKLKKELEPKVKELQKRVSALRIAADDYADKARAAYNADADRRRQAAGISDKSARLSALKASKKAILKEVSTDEEFQKALNFVKLNFEEMNVIDVGISDDGIFVDVEVKYEIELEDTDFGEDGDLEDIDELEDGVNDYVRYALDLPEEGDYNEPFVFDDSGTDSEFFIEVLETYTEGNPEVSRYFRRGYTYLPDGDPGYPDEYDFDIKGWLYGVAVIKITKIK